MNFLIDPNVSYLLLVSGFVMVALALLSPGTGLLEIGGLLAIVLAGYGIYNLPVSLWALGVLVVGLVAFLISLRKARRQWAFLSLSVVAIIVGSVFLFQGNEDGTRLHPVVAIVTSLSAVSLLWVIGDRVLDATSQQPSHDLVRLISEYGQARTDIKMEGTVYVHGEEWSARSDSFIAAGTPVKIIGRDGLILLVEPKSTASND